MILKVLVVLFVAAFLWAASRYLQARAQSAANASPLTKAQAAAILGIAADSDSETIRTAHRRLIAANHPDRGGSDFLAQQINQARDVLMQAEQQRR